MSLITREPTMKVGPVIQAIRRKQEMTLPDLASAAGVDRGGLSRIENGKQDPSATTLAKLAKALNVTVESFYQAASAPDNVTPHNAANPTSAPNQLGTGGRLL